VLKLRRRVCDVEHVQNVLCCGLTRAWVYSLPLLASDRSEGGCDGVPRRSGLVGLSMSLKASAFARARQKKTGLLFVCLSQRA
jgi:hypothetical protein